MEPEYSVTIRTWREKNGAPSILVGDASTAARASTIGAIVSGDTWLNSSPVSGIWTSGPAAHRPRQPTRLTATSVVPASVSRSASRSRMSWD